MRLKAVIPAILLLAMLLMANLLYTRSSGFHFSGPFPDWFYQFRVPRVLAAMWAGMALALSGLALQTLFRNPLAGPFLTGITPGASLGIALLLMAFPAGFGISSLETLGLSGAGFIGGLSVLVLQLYISRKRNGIFTLLLSGVMLGYIAGAVTEILQTLADAQQLKSFVMWGLGNFDRVTLQQMYFLCFIGILGAFLLFFMRHQLDAWLPGDLYAQNSGLGLKRFRFQIILLGGILAGVTTAICGPIGFVGLAAPHLSRMIHKTNNHGKLIVPTAVWGAVLCVFADFIAHNLLQDITLNVNAICAVFGAPIVLWVLLKKRMQ